MRELGIFSFKVNLYQYCERYLIAFKDRSYGELVLHAPPLSGIVVILLPFIFNRDLMARFSRVLSVTMFWIENCFFILMFGGFEMVVAPLAYIKNWFVML